jgi:GNAT superfamily N-acetyltransferase
MLIFKRKSIQINKKGSVNLIYKADLNLRKKLITMFEGMKNEIVQSYLQGHMGSAWVDDPSNPTAAQIIVGVFIFYAGDANAKASEELLRNLLEDSLVIVNAEEWKKRIEAVHKDSITKKIQRYAFEKNTAHLNRKHIGSFLSLLPQGYELRKIDSNIAYNPSLQELSEDITSQFESIDHYISKGIGYCIFYNGQIVSVASSYCVYDDGIEVEVDTHPNHRRKGLATVVTSALILDCLDRGKYPNWDAANLNSVELAKKLGYVVEEAYDTYRIVSKF